MSTATGREMTRAERVQAALAGDPVDRPPISLWMHFPNADQSAEQLAESTTRWQTALDLDFIKLMPPGDYACIDWGLQSEYRGAAGGTRDTTYFPIQTLDDWANVQPVDITQGFNAEVVRACTLARAAVGDDVPVLQTIFSPLTIANKLSDGRVIEHLRSNPDVIHDVLAVIEAVTIEMTRASLAAGAQGIFFASQCASAEVMTRDEHDAFGVRHDLPVLLAAQAAGSGFTMVHVHGAQTYLDVLAAYPGHALNWHDRRVGPTIASVLHDYPQRAAVAGIDEHGMAALAVAEVREQVLDARQQAQDRHLLLGPGCVIRTATPAAQLRAAVAAARENQGR